MTQIATVEQILNPQYAIISVPRKSASAPKVSTQMSNKVAYPVFVTGGVIAGLAIWEVYRCRGGVVV